MRTALNNIFKKQQPAKRYVKVVKKLANTTRKWLTIDVYGRSFVADSDAQWKPGDYVEIQNGRIIGETGVIEEPTKYTG